MFISRELTELQGGQIGVQSEAGKGSQFCFYVKAARVEPPLEFSQPSVDSNTTSSVTKKSDTKAIVEPVVSSHPENSKTSIEQLHILGKCKLLPIKIYPLTRYLKLSRTTQSIKR